MTVAELVKDANTDTIGIMDYKHVIGLIYRAYELGKSDARMEIAKERI